VEGPLLPWVGGSTPIGLRVVRERSRLFTGLVTGCLLGQSPGRLAPSSMPRVGKVDERYQSYNVEMVEVTGGRFWAPYKKGAAVGSPASSATASNQCGAAAKHSGRQRRHVRHAAADRPV
jgi:hypothetical protein